MKKYQKGFIGWMIPAIYGILASLAGINMMLTGDDTEKIIGFAIITIAVITFAKMKKYLFAAVRDEQGAP